VAANVKSGATGTFHNIKLYVDGLPVGSASDFGSLSTTTYAVAPFTGLSLTIPANGSKVLVVKADISTSGNATSADTAAFALVPDYDGVTAASQESIVAKGASSGLAITGGFLDFTTADKDIPASTMTAYGTKLSVAFATDTPSGSAYAAGADDQIMAKIVVTNSANVGNYEATIKYMNFAVTQSGASKPNASGTIEVKVYKKGAVQTANLVATTTFLATQNIGDIKLTNGTSSATNFISTVISAGESETFILTMDTDVLDMGSDTGSESIGVGMAADDLGWLDGVGASDITSVNDLPLTSKTLAYPAS